jgi:hypothetical protein
MAENTKLPTRVIGGHKVQFVPLLSFDIIPHMTLQAAVNNPNVSEEAKEESRRIIDELEHDPQTEAQRRGYDEDKDETRVNAGLKATMSSE